MNTSRALCLDDWTKSSQWLESSSTSSFMNKTSCFSDKISRNWFKCINSSISSFSSNSSTRCFFNNNSNSSNRTTKGTFSSNNSPLWEINSYQWTFKDQKDKHLVQILGWWVDLILTNKMQTHSISLTTLKWWTRTQWVSRTLKCSNFLIKWWEFLRTFSQF